ncbi:MAG: 4,5-DOPA dioxygenase extradiol [Ignavibacteria bacterium]|nr:4,5-DOPA dioxygenase extradiol [Ignavibacteria bacterium]
MPVIFSGHGNPMNAIMKNEFTEGWKKSVEAIPAPESILCISAHRETNGKYINAMKTPETIHEFYGFPDELFEVQYPAKGNPVLAGIITDKVSKYEIKPDHKRGLDHGCWSVLVHMYPEANIPVIQLSLDRNLSPKEHFEFTKELSFLREKRVLIICSGNIVHNLGIIDRRNPGRGHGWAVKANEIIKNLILAGEYGKLCGYESLGTEIELAVPTPEHYLPLLYALALKNENEEVMFFNDRVVLGSISMCSLIIK